MHLQFAPTGLAVLLSALALGMPTVALADDVYLAIGFSPTTAKFAIATDKATEAAAKSEAQMNCQIAAQANDCRIVVYARHCAALVVVKGTMPIHYAASSGPDKANALGRAVQRLYSASGESGFPLLNLCNRSMGEQ